MTFTELPGDVQQHCRLTLLSSLDGAMQCKLTCSKAAVSELREDLCHG